MQMSEYSLRDYLKWYHRTSNFSKVEKRKKMERTLKALVLLTLVWGVRIVVYIAAVALIVYGKSSVKYLYAIAVIFFEPFILAYIIIIPVFLLGCVQAVIKYFVTKKARDILQKHKGIKIAIAGSFGKTSMREILKTVLSASLRVASPPHSYNTPLGISRFIGTLKGDEEVIIFEFGEYYSGDVMELCKIVNPDIGIITGVNEAHLEKFKNLDQTAKTIFELADWLGNKPVYVNAESEFAKKYAHTNHILYSGKGIADLKIENPHTDLTGTSFDIIKDEKKMSLKSGLLGLHQIGPLAVAACIADSLNISPDEIRRGIAETKPFEHRLELKKDENNVYTLDDSYNGNPTGVKVIIDFLKQIKGHRIWYVTPGLVEMGTSTKEIHKEIGRQLADARIEKVVLIKNSVTPYIEDGLKEAHFAGDIIWFDDALKAYTSLPTMTLSGDVVVLQNDWPDQYA